MADQHTDKELQVLVKKYEGDRAPAFSHTDGSSTSSIHAGVSRDRYDSLMRYWRQRSHKRLPLHCIAPPSRSHIPSELPLSLEEWAAEFQVA